MYLRGMSLVFTYRKMLQINQINVHLKEGHILDDASAKKEWERAEMYVFVYAWFWNDKSAYQI